MDNQITLEQIRKFSQIYNNKDNKTIESEIVEKGLEDACIDRSIIVENQPIFNIELPESKRYNQKDSNKCWIYAGINVIKHNVAKNLNIDINELEISNNYIAFFDKLEKSNNAYENIINLEKIDFDFINKENIIKYGVAELGYWQWFVAIVEKYGIVPLSVMPDVVESINYEKITALYTEKVKNDIIQLIELKTNNQDINKIREVKNKFLEENYIFLSKILGEPNFNFNYEYKDKNGACIKLQDITAIQFRDRFLTLKLDEFVSIGNVPMYNKEYNKIYRKKYLANIYQNSSIYFLNLPIEELKELSIKQLKDGIPVWMATHIRKFRDKKSGILDTRLYNYRQILDFKPLSKEDALNLSDIESQHAMTFCGVYIENSIPIRWKVEDSYGNEDRINGYYVMNDNFFNEFVLNVIIHKRYLSQEQLHLLNQEAIEFDIEEPF